MTATRGHAQAVKPSSRNRTGRQSHLFRLGNKQIGWQGRWAGRRLTSAVIFDRINNEQLRLTGPCFKIVLGSGKAITSSDFTLSQRPEMKPLKVDAASLKLANHFPGREFVAYLVNKREHLDATWSVRLRAKANYLIERLTLQPVGRNMLIKQIILFRQHLPGAKTVGVVQGSPVVFGHFFMGYENPMAWNTVTSAAVVRCRFDRNAILQKVDMLCQNLVIGVAPVGQLRRGFLNYLEWERPRPYAPFLTYNSWYDLGANYDQAQCLRAIHRISRQLVIKRDVRLNSFLFDYGWDNNKTLWQFNKGFPDGFTPLRLAAAKYHVGIGAWLSPTNYEIGPATNIRYGRLHGYKVNAAGLFSLADPKYYRLFRHVCMKMIHTYGVNEFKFDGLAAEHGFVWIGGIAVKHVTREGRAMLRLDSDLRKAEPDLYIDQTSGTWSSPFWLLYVDNTWRNGGDHGYMGKGSWAQKSITYADAKIYHNVVLGAPLYPLNSLMAGSVIYARDVAHLHAMSDRGFRDQVRALFGSGTQLQELYITPKLLNPQNWNDLAEAAKWARTNADVLVDTHWVGGDPSRGQVYGWADWTPERSILVLRNPGDHSTTFTADIGKLLQLPPGAKKSFRMRSPWPGSRRKPALFLRAGRVHTFILRPFQVLVLQSGSAPTHG